MAASLKDLNKWPLLAAILANFAVFYVAMKTNSLLGGARAELLAALNEAIPAGIALVLIGVANAQLSSSMKARIVFTRWDNPMPGREAFSRLATEDDRIDFAALDKLHGPFPTAPQEQNTRWYQLYKSVENHPSVGQVHREFLFTRDYTCLAVMMFIVLGGVGLYQIPSLNTALIYIGLMAAQVIVVDRAARNHGRRFVTTVLALKSAGK